MMVKRSMLEQYQNIDDGKFDGQTIDAIIRTSMKKRHQSRKHRCQYNVPSLRKSYMIEKCIFVHNGAPYKSACDVSIYQGLYKTTNVM